MLADNPHVLRRLREEIISVLGTDQTPTFEHVREMKYLRAVINGETCRHLPYESKIDRCFWVVRNPAIIPPCVRRLRSGCRGKATDWIFADRLTFDVPQKRCFGHLRPEDSLFTFPKGVRESWFLLYRR